MQFDRTFARTLFNADVLKAAVDAFADSLPKDDRPYRPVTIKVTRGNEAWSFDTLDEFLGEHRRPHSMAHLAIYSKSSGRVLSLQELSGATMLSIKDPERAAVVRLASIFESRAAEFFVPPPPPPPPPPPAPPTIFIGHGGSRQWRDLKDHLQDSHGYEVKAYE